MQGKSQHKAISPKQLVDNSAIKEERCNWQPLSQAAGCSKVKGTAPEKAEKRAQAALSPCRGRQLLGCTCVLVWLCVAGKVTGIGVFFYPLLPSPSSSNSLQVDLQLWRKSSG